MIKATLHGPRDLRLEWHEISASKLAPDEIHVETLVTALSTGTDRGNYEGAERVPGAPDYPRWVGYSNVGKVRQVGENVTRVKVGDRIFTDRPHLSEFVMKDSEHLAAIGEKVTSEAAAFTYLYFLGLYSLRRGHFSFGQTVAVVGLGILGLATVELAYTWGARVVAIGNNESRLQKAAEVGAHLTLDFRERSLHEAVDQFTHKRGVDLAVLAANSWPAYRTGVEVLGEDGRMAVLSLLGRGEEMPDFNPLALEWFYHKALNIISVRLTHADRARLEEDWTYLLELIEQRTIQPERLITHRLPYRDMAKAYEAAHKRDKSMVGTIFLWDESRGAIAPL